MQRVLKNIFLIDSKLENRLKFWTLLGPFSLLLSITLAPFELAVFSICVFFLCYRFSFKGLVLALLSLVAYSFYIQVNLEEKHLWNLGLQISIGMGLLISTYGFEEIKNYLSDHSDNKNKDFISLQNLLKEKEQGFAATNKNLEENMVILKGELNKKTQKLMQVTQENENLKKDLQDGIQRKDYLLNELDNKVKEIDELRIKQDELFEKISFLKDEEFLHEKNQCYQKEIDELKISNQTIQKQNNKILNELNEKKQKIEELLLKLPQTNNIEDLERKIKEKENEIFSLQERLKSRSKTKHSSDQNLSKEDADKIKDFTHINSLYLQLKKQFEDKQFVLHRTRQELFQVKEKLTAHEREQKDDFEDLSEFEKNVLSDLDQTLHDLQKYTDENKALEDIITRLVNQQEDFKIK